MRTSDAALRRALVALARDDGKAGVPNDSALPLPELAQRLLALTAPVDVGMARRLLGAALGAQAATLPDAVDTRALARLLHGEAAPKPLEAAEFVVVDLETTGLSLGRSTILEIGAVRVTNLQPSERFETLVDPERVIPPTITRLTGIDARTVAGAPRLAAALPRFRDWLGRDPDPVFVAHHASFDERFVRRALAEHALPPLAGPVLCTRRLGRRLLPELGSYGLDSLCAHFGIGNRARHRALGDAAAAAELLVVLVGLGRERAGLRTLGELLDFAAAPAPRRRPRAAPPGPRLRRG